jgi:hypothetical protein
LTNEVAAKLMQKEGWLMTRIMLVGYDPETMAKRGNNGVDGKFNARKRNVQGKEANTNGRLRLREVH